jgi:hypothetical protein
MRRASMAARTIEMVSRSCCDIITPSGLASPALASINGLRCFACMLSPG